MNAFVLIVWLMTANGIEVHRVEFGGAGRTCEAVARDIRLGTRSIPPGTVLILARCVREHEA